jgi:hypothetical protein
LVEQDGHTRYGADFLSDRDESIGARLAAWQARGDPQCLWPHVRASDRLRAHERIASAAQTLLAGDATYTYLRADGEAEVKAAGVAAYVSGMGPLLGHWVECGRLGASAPLAALLAVHLEQGRARAEKLDAELVRVLDACAAHGVDPIVIKGSHLGHEYFAEPGLRPASDIDLLIHPEQLGRAHAAFHDAGLHESRKTTYPERSEWKRSGEAQALVTLDMDHADNPWSLDVHTRIERSYFRGLRAGFGEIPFRQTREWMLQGRRALVLEQPLLTAFLALNASYGIDQLRLLKIVELAFVVRQDVAARSLELSRLSDLIARTGTARFVYPAFALAERLVPGLLPGSFMNRLEAASTPRMRRVVAEAHSCGMHLPQRSLGEKLMWARGPVETLRNVLDMLRPPDDGLSFAELRRSYVRRVRRAVGGQMAFRL